jgi:integrase
MPQHRSHAILLDSLKRILSPIDRSSLDGKRDHALLLLGFAAGFRAGELSRLTAGQFRDRYGTPLSVNIRGNQLKGLAKTIVIRRGRSQVTDPLFALEEWLAAAGIWGEDPLFQHISLTSKGTMASGRLLSPADIGNIVRRRAADAGWDDPHLTGNSLRYGHIITLLAEGDVDL